MQVVESLLLRTGASSRASRRSQSRFMRVGSPRLIPRQRPGRQCLPEACNVPTLDRSRGRSREGARSWTMGFQRTRGLGAFAFPEWWLMGPISAPEVQREPCVQEPRTSAVCMKRVLKSRLQCAPTVGVWSPVAQQNFEVVLFAPSRIQPGEMTCRRCLQFGSMGWGFRPGCRTS